MGRSRIQRFREGVLKLANEKIEIDRKVRVKVEECL